MSDFFLCTGLFLVDFSGGKESKAFSLFDEEKETGISFLGDSRMKDVYMSAAKDSRYLSSRRMYLQGRLFSLSRC